jgi:hypothetical protein
MKLKVKWVTTVTEHYEREIEIPSIEDLVELCSTLLDDDEKAKLRAGDFSPLTGECYGEWDGLVAESEGNAEYVSTNSREVESVKRVP